MAKALAYTRPEVLRWARESAGYDVFQAAEKIGIPWSQLEIAEEGVDYLTLRQAEKAADVYERPLAALFLPAPLDEPPQEAVFRRLPDAPEPPWPPEMQLLQRRVHLRQEAAAELYEDLEETPPWPAAARRFQNAVGAGRPRGGVLAAVARELLGVTRETQTEWARTDEYAPLRGWTGAVESIGVLVMQEGSMQVDLMRGFASVHETVPAVVLNTNDNPRARAFTVLHELAHLAFLAAGARATEVQANDFAGEVVMPREWLAEEFRALSRRSLIDRVDAVARIFGVTPFAAAVRLQRANLGPSDQVGQVIGATRTRTTPPRRSGRGQYYYRTIASLGPAYIRLVFSALDSGAVSYPTASTLLGNVRVDNFETLREHVSRRG